MSYEAAATLHGLDRSTPDAVEFTVDRNRRNYDLPFTVHTTTMTEADRLRRGRRIPGDVGHADDHRPRPRPSPPAPDRGGHRQRGAARLCRRRRCSPKRLETLRGSGRWGCRLIEDLIVDSGGHTMLERRFLQLVREAGSAAAADAGRPSQERAPRRPRRLPLRRGQRRGRGVRPARPLDARPNVPGTPSGATSSRTSADGCTSTRGTTSPSGRITSAAP